MSSYTGSRRLSSMEIRNIFRQNIAIQAVPSDCSIEPPVGNGRERSNTPILSRPRKPPSKMFKPCGFSIHPPGEVQQQLMEHPCQEAQVASATLIAVILEHAHCCPGVYRGVDVAERPFIRRQLAVRMHQPDFAQQQKLLLGEIWIDQ